MTEPRVHDFTRQSWGHALHGFEPTDADPEVMSGTCHAMRPVHVGDEMVWETPYGTARGRIENMTRYHDPRDMYRLIAVRIVSRRILRVPDRPVGTVLPLPPGMVAFEAPGWEPADPDYRTVVRVR